MPTTVTSLVIFVVLLAPGLCFTLRQDYGRGPLHKRTALREVGALLLSGLFIDSVVLGTFALARALFPESTPNIGRLVRDPDSYLRAEYAFVLRWAVPLWFLACLAGYVIAAVPWTDLSVTRSALKRFPKIRRLVASERGRSPVSAWWKAFEYGPDFDKHVICRLDDGTSIQGVLWSYNPSDDEVDDRAFVLRGPLVLKEPDGPPVTADLGAVVVSARRLQYVYVRYLPKDAVEGGDSNT